MVYWHTVKGGTSVSEMLPKLHIKSVILFTTSILNLMGFKERVLTAEESVLGMEVSSVKGWIYHDFIWGKVLRWTDTFGTLFNMFLKGKQFL